MDRLMGSPTPGDQAPFRMTPLVFHVLLTMADAPGHAYGMMKEIARRTDGRVEPGPGSMHFTLNKLLEADMITESDRASGTGDGADERRRYYRLTDFGRSVLRAEVDALEEIVRLARTKTLAPEG
jgi:DNA-binding PadR family transcriptional regulator